MNTAQEPPAKKPAPTPLKLARRLTILNAGGLYARPSARFVCTILKFGDETEVRVTKGDYTANGRSIMGVLMLAAPQGTELLVEAEGPQAREILEALTELVNNGFGREEPCLPIPEEHGRFIVLSEERDRGETPLPH